MSENEVVGQFERQVEQFAASTHANHPESIEMLVRLIAPTSTTELLDVCCGPGLVACALSPHVRSVVGIDITPGMVAKAERTSKEKGLDNTRFKVADAMEIPFPDRTFDVVMSRFAFHQLPRPESALREQVRVAKARGLVVVFDSLTSEDRAEADYHNEAARLREPEHARSLSLGELVRYFHSAGLDVERYQALEFTIGVEEWIAQAHAPEPSREKARRMLRDAVGTRKFGGRRVFEEEGTLKYTARWGLLVGRAR